MVHKNAAKPSQSSSYHILTCVLKQNCYDGLYYKSATQPMEHTKHTQKSRDIFSQQSFTPNGIQPLRGVGQDKDAPKRVRIATSQPVLVKNSVRTHQMDTNTSRTKKYSRK